MKQCGRCGTEQPLAEFHRRGNGHQAWCKSCRRAYDRSYHLRTRPTRIRQAKARHEKLVAWYRELKSHTPCADCGGFFHPVAMTWDHLPGQEKVGDVGTLLRRHSRETLLNEIAKCELVCANCHAVRSFKRRGA